MNKAVFICRVPDRAAFRTALQAIAEHNQSEMVPIGGRYSREEFWALDPMRANYIEGLYAVAGGICDHIQLGGRRDFMERWTRGEDISGDGALVRHEGELWLEVVNSDGGACTTKWLRERFPECGWIGTNEKPVGFYESPIVSRWLPFKELEAFYMSLRDRED